jgi:hypothetical protein
MSYKIGDTVVINTVVDKHTAKITGVLSENMVFKVEYSFKNPLLKITPPYKTVYYWEISKISDINKRRNGRTIFRE